MSEPNLEKHYTLGELSKAWRIGVATLRGWFTDEEGVVKWGGQLKKGRQRAYVSLRVPSSVAQRVYRKRTGRDYNAG